MEIFQFGNFTISNAKILYRDEQVVHIPPKEMAVLQLLVLRAGEIVPKELLIKEIWCGAQVSDESLTRCVYVIRKILGETPDNRYIDTVYGKGYRFIKPVSTSNALHLKETTGCEGISLIALFPFELTDKKQSQSIFDYILNQDEILSGLMLRFLPAALTASTHNFAESFSNLRASGVAYFITGGEFHVGKTAIVRIELTESRTLRVLQRQSVVIDSDPVLNLIRFSRAVSTLLQAISAIKEPALADDVVMVKNHVPGTRHDQNIATLEFEKYRRRPFANGLIDSDQIMALTNMAGCYFALGMLKVIPEKKADEIISTITERILEIQPGNVLAMFLNFISTSQTAEQSEADFHLAMVMSPLSSEVYYYYACHLVTKLEYSRAEKVVSMALGLNPHFFAAHILKITNCALRGDDESAINEALELTGKKTMFDVVVYAFLAVLYRRVNDTAASDACLESIMAYRTRNHLIDSIFTFLLDTGNPVGKNLLALGNVSVIPVSDIAGDYFLFTDNSH